MKNIHVLPTDKPSRIHFYSNVTFGVSKEHLNWKQGRNIYITNDEDLMIGDYYIAGVDIYKCLSSIELEGLSIDSYCRKIILTTDQDLINDGVQDIDDEFLEWFVNNPSCEKIETESFCKNGDDCLSQGPYDNLCNIGYKIIIPKEEPKQETIEEAAERLSELQEGTYTIQHKTTYQHGFIDGAKWQQQQDKNKYSEEEVIKILISYLHYLTTNDNRTSEEWFEQFKKK
jgi:hypothetical protein